MFNNLLTHIVQYLLMDQSLQLHPLIQCNMRMLIDIQYKIVIQRNQGFHSSLQGCSRKFVERLSFFNNKVNKIYFQFLYALLIRTI